MNRIYKFIAGNSRVTPIGITLAVALALTFRHAGDGWIAPAYAAVLIVTLAASTFERVQ